MTDNRNPKFFYGYVIVAAAFFIMAINWGIFQIFGVFFVPLLAEFGWSRAMLSGASSLGYLLVGLFGIAAGIANDKLGPRVVFAVCGLFFGLGHLLMSQVNSVWQLYLFFGVVVGIGASAVDVVLLSTIARWFVRRRGLMSGVAKVGTGLGILIMPLVARVLISNYGWRTSYTVLGALSLVLIVLFAQLLRRDPNQMQQLPDGKQRTAVNSSNLVETGLSLREAINTKQFWIIFVTFLTFVLCTQTIIVHIAPHAEEFGISAMNAAGLISIIGGTSMIGRLVMGYACDRIGTKRALVICFLVLIATLSWLQFSKELWMLYLFGAVYGFSHGGFFAVYSPMVAWLFGTRSQGAIFGSAALSATIGGALGPLLVGYTFDLTNSYQLGFLILVVMSLAGLVLALLLKPISTPEHSAELR